MDLRQTQSLVMTPQLQQAIKLLQLSNVELLAYVDQELERNPMLERADEEEAASGAAESPPADGEQPSTDHSERAELNVADDAVQNDEAPLDVDYEDMYAGESASDAAASDSSVFWGSGVGRGDFNGDDVSLEQTLSRQISLQEHLLDQLNIDLGDPIDRIIGVHLIDLVDEAGYLAGELSGVAQLLGCDEARVEATLERLQRFDPPGVFARNLAECLSIQLDERNRLDPAMQRLLDNLDLLAKRDVDALKKVCAVDGDDLADMAAEIRSLNPKPGLAFDNTVSQAVTPDVMMRPEPSGGWVVELNTDTLPRVLVNERYYARISREARDKKDKTYITEHFHSANWLVKSLHQRANTILRVATEIVRQQDSFFVHGVQYLKPLVLKDIAAAISMHESTVSRVTTNKYMSTPRGMYELKYFFTSAIASSSGGASHSAVAVRYRIKALVDEEPDDRILSDDKIVELLKDEGIDIARRTVAKYRESMRIPSSVQRRREKLASV